MQPQVYSYLRFSTPEQKKGDTIRRQIEGAERWAAEQGLVLDKSLSYTDTGVSALYGRNNTEGRLAVFLDAVDRGYVAAGSYLLVEDLDRLSRQNVGDASYLLQGIVRAGIIVVTLGDGKRYTRATMGELDRFLMMAVTFGRAHGESARKAQIGKANWRQKRKGAKERKLTAKCPAWLALDREADLFRVDRAKAKVVRRVFEMYLAGAGLNKIAKTLNAEGVATFGTAEYWQRSYLTKLLSNWAVVGTFIPHTLETTETGKRRIPQEPVRGYFPAIVDKTIFAEVQALRDRTRGTVAHGGKPLANILGGLAKCPKCTGTMTRVMKGSPKRGGKPKLVCARAKAGKGCQYVSVDYETLETALMGGTWYLDPPLPDEDTQRDWDALEDQIGVTKEAIGNLSEAIARKPSEALETALASHEDTLSSLEDDQRALNSKIDAGSELTLKMRVDALEETLGVDGEPDREAANAALKRALRGVVIDHFGGAIWLLWRQGGVSSVQYAWPSKESSTFDLERFA